MVQVKIYKIIKVIAVLTTLEELVQNYCKNINF